MHSAGAPLPTTFRISPTCTFADEIRSKLKSRYDEFKSVMVQADDDGERQYPPQPMLWYPDELAWFMSLSKKALKKTPGLEKFHQYLVAETESGNITRQVDWKAALKHCKYRGFDLLVSLAGGCKHDPTTFSGRRTASPCIGYVSIPGNQRYVALWIAADIYVYLMQSGVLRRDRRLPSYW